ncbi:hypothetical protein [Thiothrix eikelboomii]|nr:hypothetical protein [Thiothrix eikelboomii]
MADVLLLSLDELHQLSRMGVLPTLQGRYCFIETVQRYVQMLNQQVPANFIIKLVELEGLTEELVIQQLKKITANEVMIELPEEGVLLEQLNVQ